MADKKEFDFLIVGAGLFGATFARLATDRGMSCLVIDRRNHAGGNVWCEDVGGITVHHYGPHIFHTSDEKVWRFVNSFVRFNRFTNSPLAVNGDRVFNLPFNMNTFRQLWGVGTPEEARKVIGEQTEMQKRRLFDQGILEPRNLEEKALTMVGADLYRLLIRDYTEKQWGRSCRLLPPSIISRIPLRFTFDNNYFNDSFQGIPEGGYNPLIEALLKGSRVVLGADFIREPDFWRRKARTVVFGGQIDEYFGFRLGHLQYRSLRWETEELPTPNFQGNAVVNYTDASRPFTRVIEHKHFAAFGEDVYKIPFTVVSREYPSEWSAGKEPFYPVNDHSNEKLLAAYRELAAREKDTVFGGRLAEYRYYDMDDVIRRAFDAFEDCLTHKQQG